MPRKKTIPTEPQPDPPAGITEATVELAPDSIEQPSPDILDGSTPPGEDLETPAVPTLGRPTIPSFIFSHNSFIFKGFQSFEWALRTISAPFCPNSTSFPF